MISIITFSTSILIGINFTIRNCSLKTLSHILTYIKLIGTGLTSLSSLSSVFSINCTIVDFLQFTNILYKHMSIYTTLTNIRNIWTQCSFKDLAIVELIFLNCTFTHIISCDRIISFALGTLKFMRKTIVWSNICIFNFIINTMSSKRVIFSDCWIFKIWRFGTNMISLKWSSILQIQRNIIGLTRITTDWHWSHP